MNQFIFRTVYFFIVISGVVLVTDSAFPSDRHLHIYLDADLTHATASSRSIEQGIRTALSESVGRSGRYVIQLMKTDHRGNSRRSLNNLKTILKDPKALAVYGGLHSPPLLANLSFINKKRLLHLIPWAAAGPITRYPGKENWVFRLSIDDTKAGEVLIRHAVEARGRRYPALLLEETGWGKSNARTMTRALQQRGIRHAGIHWFRWGCRAQTAKVLLRKILNAGADCVILVANAPEGKVLAKAMAELGSPNQIPLYSHWGITGGNFVETVTPDIREKLDLEFIQTHFSFLSTPLSPMGRAVLEQAARLFPDEISEGGDIRAPAGFIHAYDLTKLLMAALAQAGPGDDITTVRARVRQALEHLESPVPGLIKTYTRPFSSVDPDNPDAHEALSIDDFTMGRYDRRDRIVLIP